MREHEDIQLSWENIKKIILNIKMASSSIVTSFGAKSAHLLFFMVIRN